MAVVFMTGWEMGSSTWSMSGADAVASPGRGGWSQYNLTLSTANMSFPMYTPVSEFYFGFAHKVGQLGGLNPIAFFAPSGNPHLGLNHTFGSGTFEVYNLQGTPTLLGSSTRSIVANRWYYIEGYVKIADSGGKFELKVDGDVWISTITGDTRGDPTYDTVNVVRFGANATIVGGCTYDDAYICDTTGTTNTSYLGDIRILGLLPNAPGDVTQLSRGGADSGANYSQVDDRPPNDATDYVYGTNTTSYDLYNIPDTLNASGVRACRLWWRGWKDDASYDKVAPKLKMDTNADGVADTEYTGADYPLSNTWSYGWETYDQQPDSTPWDTQKVDALQIGIKSR